MHMQKICFSMNMLIVSRFIDNWGICILKIKKFRQVFEQKKAKYNLKNQIKKKITNLQNTNF